MVELEWKRARVPRGSVSKQLCAFERGMVSLAPLQFLTAIVHRARPPAFPQLMSMADGADRSLPHRALEHGLRNRNTELPTTNAY